MKLAQLASVLALAVAACATSPRVDSAAQPSPPKPRDSRVAVLDQMLSTVNAGKATEYAHLYAEKAVITVYGSDDLSGRAAIEAHEVELLSKFPGARLAFYATWLADSSAVVRYAVTCHLPDGRAMGHEGLLFLHFDEAGLIDWEHRYLDSLTPMAQLGTLGPEPARPLPVLPQSMTSESAQNSMLERDDLVTVRTGLNALAGADERQFLTSCTDDAVVDELMLPHAMLASAWLEAWTAAVANPRIEIANSIAVGNDVAVEFVLHGTLDAPLGPVSAKGKSFTVHRAALFRVTHGHIAQALFATNGEELARAVGAWPLTAPK